MAVASTKPTTGGRDMKTMEKQQEWKLTALDRCDRCGSQAYVEVTGLNGNLMFCGHHYNKIMDNAVGYDKMMKFAITIVDERERLIENKLIGSSN